MKILMFLCLMILGFNIIANYLYRQQLFIYGLQLIVALQQYQSKWLNSLFTLISLLVDPIVVLLSTITFLIAAKIKRQALIALLYILFNTYLAGILKAFYADPRPIWFAQKILNIGLYCPQQYGNPSGHSWFGVIVVFGIMGDKISPGRFYWKGVIGGLLCLSVGISRMYVGAHSINQVLQGWTWGIIMNVIYLNGLKKQLESLLSQIKLLKIFCIGITMVCLSIVAFYINLGVIIPQEWKNNILIKCNKKIDADHLNWMMIVINLLMVSLCLGVVIGSIYNNNSRLKLYMQGKWAVNMCFRYTLVNICCLVVGFVCFSLLFFFWKDHLAILVVVVGGGLVSGFIYSNQTLNLLIKFNIISFNQQEEHKQKIK